MKKFLSMMIVASIGLMVLAPSPAQAVEWKGVQVEGSAGVTNKRVVRGLKDRITDDAVVQANLQAEWMFIRLGGDLNSANLDSRSGTVNYGAFGEVFYTVWDREFRAGVTTADEANSSSELYIGSSGPILFGVDYDVAAYRSNQTLDLWYDAGISRVFGDFKLGVATAYGDYEGTNAVDGLEFVSGAVTWLVPEKLVSGVDLELKTEYTHVTDDQMIRGVNANDHITVDASFNF